MKTKYLILWLSILLVGVHACKEGSRYESTADDTTPPGPPVINRWEPLYGGARFFYTIPPDEDLLSINGEYTNAQGKTFQFTSSYYTDSLDVIGLGDTSAHIINLYAVDRAGNRSEVVSQEITPLEPTISRVAKNIVVKSGFSSFFVDWENELKQLINVYIEFKYTDKGMPRDIVSVFSSNQLKERKFINNLYLTPEDPIDVTIRVEDQYGNSTDAISFGQIFLKEDIELDKSIWIIPEANDSTIEVRGKRINTGVPAMFGNSLEGRMSKLMDGIIDRGDNLNFFHTGSRGRTGISKDGNMPWNIIIDLGAYYQLSRIVTMQRHSGGLANIERGQYYRSENCGEFRLFVFNEATEKWDTISTQRTPIPQGISELQFVKLGEAGDMAYFYPDEPDYTISTRWFRYEGLHCFDDNYSSTGANCMSELTLYGKKVND
ncbi:MAG: hypothetical protein EZS26_003020 [Candidatus Ordinivivax streblomastigis]|uniref:Uncharacterized protein n=1 Tax=Candidatus Ordinivivax streblomastigis TaxID=2540710 RepID=A0A5M8NWT8_9BACT|nr:MAG: hypothetical protein EZS26_003020 [Candidatus Ordinivivax streblomastigis]